MTSIIDKALSAVGLMRVRDIMDRIVCLEAYIEQRDRVIADMRETTDSLRPDALKWRARAERERIRGQRRRAGK